MSNLKKYFENKTSRTLTVESVNSIAIDSELNKDERIIPSVDFSDYANFVHYGSAELYGTRAVSWIYDSYPYDGSRKEKETWYQSGSAYDNYVFDSEYPKTTGYVNFDGTQCVTIFGGPSVDNVYQSGTREANLVYDFDKGVTIEFWMDEVAGRTGSVVVFDSSNSGTAVYGTPDYFRVLALLSGTETDPEWLIYVLYNDSLDTFYWQLSDVSQAWQHYAFTFKSEAGMLVPYFYHNGQLDESASGIDYGVTPSSPIPSISNGLAASVGAMLEADAWEYFGFGTGGLGQLGLVGSLDEFRFWKTARTFEKIAQNWFTSVYGGTNTQDDNLDLGVYFKFNEGITGTSSIDSVVLDYAGRASNGTFVNYNTSCRSTGSAMTDEIPDPIMYANHPDVLALYESKQQSGIVYDTQNTNSFYKLFPGYLLEEDEEAGNNFKYITQIISSYLDELHMFINELPKVGNVNHLYDTGGKPLPFAKHLLESHGLTVGELFADAELLESIGNRNDSIIFEQSVKDIKNTIYHRLYDNLTNIFKSKGTEEAIRHALRCFGVDDELYRLVVNADNQTVRFDESKDYQTVTRKKVIDFYNVDRFEGTVIQTASNADETNYVAGYELNKRGGFTVEVDVIAPEKQSQESEFWISTDFLTSSICGYRDASNTGSYEWNNNSASFDVLIYRDDSNSSSGRFCLTGTFGSLESDTINDLYDGRNWHLYVRANTELHKETDSRYIEFGGYKYEIDQLADSFALSVSYPAGDVSGLIAQPKRYYVGSLHSDFLSASLIYRTDVRVADFKVWQACLEDNEIISHAKDINSFGRDYGSDYDSLLYLDGIKIKNSAMLALHWDFELVTGSNNVGELEVLDISSGSADFYANNTYGFLSESLCLKHPGLCMYMPADSSDVVDVEYIQIAKSEIPGSVGTSGMVGVFDENSESIPASFRPVQHSFSLEKSMWRTISEEILKTFSAIVEFNNLIGMPLDKYKPSYDRLRTVREKYFANVTDRSTIERFTSFYKWLDGAVVAVISNLVPAGASFSVKIGDVIESHVLERNKVQYQLPVYHSAKQRENLATIDMSDVQGDQQYSIEGTITMPTMTGLPRADERKYACVQTTGRKENNLWLRDHPEDFGQNYIESPYVEGLVDYAVPVRDRVETIFVNKFASPGGADTMGVGACDPESEEYSVYNSLNYRNLSVRMPLDTLMSKHSAQFGYDSQYGAPSASYCKANRNTRYVAIDDNTLEPRYDNEFVGHSIPMNDKQYAWITASVETASVGYAPEDGMDNIDGEYVPFFEFGTASTLQDALHYDRFGYPTWKQLRSGDHLEARLQKKNNQIVIEPSDNNTASYHEPAVSWNYPLRQRLVDNETGDPAHIVYPFSNQRQRFAQPALQDQLLGDYRQDNRTLYDSYSKMYLNDSKEAEFVSLHYEEQIFPRAVNVGSTTQRDKPDYQEVVGTGSNGYDRGVLERRKIWATNKSDRGRSFPAGHNAFDKEDFRNSVWPLDLNDDESEAGSVGKGGELNNTWQDAAGYRYTSFTGQDNDAKMATASCLYAHNVRINNDSYEVGMPNWTCGSEAGNAPWYNDYNEFAADLRPMSQRYGFIPEYRVSEYMDFFVDDNGGNFRATQRTLPIKLDGVEHSASSDSVLFAEHTFTDDFEYFNELMKDHEQHKENARLSLKCSGLKKLLPYNGFYPQHRTVQLANLFSSSFAEHIEGLSGAGTGTESIDQQDQWKLQSMLQPWFSPGIVYNTIKSGIAVDWPTYLGVGGFNGSAGEAAGGKAVHLDGVNDWIIIPDDGGLNAGVSDWLGISFWFKVPPATVRHSDTKVLLSRFDISDVTKRIFEIAYEVSSNISTGADPLYAVFYDGLGHSDSLFGYFDAYDGAWHHVALIYKAAVGASLWLDGVQADTLTTNLNSTLPSGSVDMVVGNFLSASTVQILNPELCFNGYVDDLAYYTGSVRLQQADVTQIYNAGRCSLFDLTTVEPAPVYWWKMGDGSGSGHDDGYNGLIYDMISGTLPAEMTGSTIVNACPGGDFGFLSTEPNFRVPFESMFSLKDYVPASSSVAGVDNSMYFVAPEWYTGSSATTRYPYFLWDSEKSSNLFEMAAHNFFGEVPRFTLKNEGLASYVSAPSSLYKPMVSGSTYYMDVTLYQTADHDMVFSTHHGPSDNLSYDGRYFGPAMQMVSVPELYTGSDNLYSMSADPTYAAYAPPYLYGKAVARLSFTPTQSRQYSLDEIQAGMTVEYINEGLVDMASASIGEDILTNGSPLWSSSMPLESSIEIRGKAKISETEHTLVSDGVYVPTSIKNINDAGYSAWAIYPKFECPVLNFADLRTASLDTDYGPYGMWLNHGRSLERNEGIWISLEESYKKKGGRDIASNTGSLLDVCGFIPSTRKIGEVADNKTIHEAVVAIPFVDNPTRSGAKTVSVAGYNMFAIDKTMYSLQTAFKTAGKPAVPKGSYGAVEDIQNTTITDMHDKMKKYYLPPALDFSTYPDINPFAMYIFEFTSNLNQGDIENIWQGLMPSIAMKVEGEDITISHSLSKVEFFGGEKLPEGVRWLLFRVKQRAEKSYYNLTADSKDDARFQFDFKVGKKAPEYNYNWPYDFFSLVESVKLDASLDIVPRVNLNVAAPEVIGDVSNIEARLGDVAMNVSKETKQQLNIGGNIANVLQKQGSKL